MATVDQQIVMKVPQEIVDAHVRAAVAQALSVDPEGLVRAVVDAAMTEKKNSYDRRTIFQEQTSEMVRKVAHEALHEWLDEMRPAIKAQVRAALDKRTKEQVAKMADLLLASLAGARFHVDIRNPE